MSVSQKAIHAYPDLMDRTVNASVRRGVAEVLRNARKLAMQDEEKQPLPAKLQYLIDELRKRD